MNIVARRPVARQLPRSKQIDSRSVESVSKLRKEQPCFNACELLLVKLVAEAEDSLGIQGKGNVRLWKPVPENW